MIARIYHLVSSQELEHSPGWSRAGKHRKHEALAYIWEGQRVCVRITCRSLTSLIVAHVVDNGGCVLTR